MLRTEIAATSFLEYCRLRSLEPKTLDAYEWALNHLEQQCPSLPHDHRSIINALAAVKGLGPESKHDLERVLRTFFKWVREEYDWPDVMAKVKPLHRKQTTPRVLSRAEIAAVWSVCETHRDQALMALVFDTGVRLGEIAAMGRDDLGDFTLRVDGKVGTRQVPISPELRDMLAGVGDQDRFWLSSTTGRPLSQSGVQQVYKRLLRRAGLRGAKRGPHVLRHTFGTEYCRLGGNVRVLQTIMGHRRLETTMVYVNLASVAESQDHAKYSPFRRLILGD